MPVDCAVCDVDVSNGSLVSVLKGTDVCPLVCVFMEVVPDALGVLGKAELCGGVLPEDDSADVVLSSLDSLKGIIDWVARYVDKVVVSVFSGEGNLWVVDPAAKGVACVTVVTESTVCVCMGLLCIVVV